MQNSLKPVSADNLPDEVNVIIETMERSLPANQVCGSKIVTG
jgi:hypothetical protein